MADETTAAKPKPLEPLILGYLTACGRLERRVRPRQALLEAGYQVSILAAVAGTLALFVTTRHLTFAGIAAQVLAGHLGARLALTASGPRFGSVRAW